MNSIDNNFLVHQHQLQCANSMFEVYFDHIEDQTNAVSVNDYLVVEPKHKLKDLMTAVVILPIIKNKIALINIFRHTINNYSLECPKGAVDEGENTNESAIRELQEETGFICQKEDMISLGYITPNPGILAARLEIYAATDCQDNSYIPKEIGHREVNLNTFEEIETMIHNSSIQDPYTIVSYYKYQIYKQMNLT